MTSLGNYHHDFPRLAKQSGYFFQLYRGRVNWLEIENLSIDDIIENRNFELLEQNLLNVVNCNLEREYDLKILDQKFVKLFKLAQLGVDYLSYCEMYLDRCVVLLQEQLIAYQQECESLKEENQKKTEELRKSKKKSRSQNYQCEKCEKVFISEVYLKFHDKRRHSNPSTPKSIDAPVKKCVDTCQQTETERPSASREMSTTSTQTLNPQKETTVDEKTEEISKIKKENNLKMDILEKEVENLKDRLKKAESTLTEKAEASNSNIPSSMNFPGPIYYPPMLPFFPSYLPQPPAGYYEFNPGYHVPVPELRHPVSPILPETVNTESAVEAKSVSSVSKPEERKEDRPKETTIEVPEVRKIVPENEFPGGNFPPQISHEKHKKSRKKFERDKENVDPNARLEVTATNSVKPPIPKKRNNSFRASLPVALPAEEQTTVEPFIASDSSVHPESEFTALSYQSITCTSTPVKEKSERKFNSEDVPARKSVSNESLISDELETNSKSFFRKVVKRKSPKLHELGKNLRKSFTTLYDSVSGTGKNSAKSERRDDKTETVDGLNDRLRELGVDPEWSGIPKNTMDQKLKDLKHRRKLLAKKNPMFSIIRQNLEKTIFTKPSLGLKKVVTSKKTNEEETGDSSKTQTDDRKPEVTKAVMYDIGTDSETEVSDLEEVEVVEPQPIFRKVGFGEPEVEDTVKDIEREMDLSVFQANREHPKNLEETRKEIFSEEKLLVDSDLDDDFLEDFDDEDFKKIASYFDNKAAVGDSKTDKTERKEVYGNEFLDGGKEKTESLSILKSFSSQSKPQFTAKKKVLFVENSHQTGKNSSENESEDEDLWFLKSDRKKDGE